MKRTAIVASLLAGGLLAPALLAADERDDQLRTRVESRLEHDATLHDERIVVSVEDGRVKLTGTVLDEAEKARATRLAQSAGAKRIDNDLTVESPSVTPSKTGKTKPTAKSAAHEAATDVSDAWITSKVKTAIALDKQLSDSDVSVSTNQDGVVVLSGVVPSEAARRHVVELANTIKGVREVKDALTVKGEPSPERAQ
jgi:osmotically-inducible protein OsmY